MPPQTAWYQGRAAIRDFLAEGPLTSRWRFLPAEANGQLAFASGAAFELQSVEVTAGVDVAFAPALLRCGTPQELAAAPDTRLRITFGLRKQGDR